MIEICTECSQDFITEADPYGVWHRPNKTHLTCGKCFIQLIEPMRLERVRQLKIALRDMGNALNKVKKHGLFHYDDCSVDTEEENCDCGSEDVEGDVYSTLQRNKEILDTINKRGEE